MRVRTSAYNGTALSSLTTLSYSSYVTTAGGQAPYMVLLISYAGSGGATDDALFFEPVYQNSQYSGDAVPDQCPGNEIPCVVLNTWQTWGCGVRRLVVKQ